MLILRPFILSRVSELMRQRVCIRFCATETLEMIRQALEEESMSLQEHAQHFL
jgi:hypothetical protein